MAVMPETVSPEEWRKRILGCLIGLPEVVVIDNISQKLASGELASVLTAPYWTDRLLGSSKTVTVPVRCLWVATGNNVIVSREIGRRSIRIRLDSSIERPWQRDQFRHKSLEIWAADQRAELVRAGLTLVQNWIANGCPHFTDKTLGSYEKWVGVTGGILETSGVGGFLGNLDEFYKVADPETEAWTAFVEGWFEKFGTEEKAVGDLLDLALESGLEISGYEDHAKKVSLGSQLARHRDQVIGGYRITSPRRVQGAARWRLEVAEGESSESR